jgi:hypothetical protein
MPCWLIERQEPSFGGTWWLFAEGRDLAGIWWEEGTSVMSHRITQMLLHGFTHTLAQLF